MIFHIIIPARIESARLPGKPLLDIAGKPMIQHVYERAMEAGATSVTVATDSLRVEEVVREFGGNACLTNDLHVSGTDRLAEAAQIIGLSDDDLVVCLQGDEPLMPATLIARVADTLKNDKQAVVATACVSIQNPEQINDPNVVKVVTDQNGHALYFSRAAIPANPIMATENQVPIWKPKIIEEKIPTSARMPPQTRTPRRNEKSLRVIIAVATRPTVPSNVTPAALSITPG